ncbi:MAG: Delta-aminolevulinic acid dehydratase [Candidatus Alkanophagales archaeon MCA70_species_2]|nr:Delta-aminolevulinic acid dehydratase [Candidatus Alkanophaga liquidiphilum]
MGYFPKLRLRRLRRTPKIRSMIRETSISASDLIYPIFIDENIKERREIKSMPAQFRISLNNIADEVKEVVELGIPAVMLFGIPSRKDERGSSAYAAGGVVQTAVRSIKKELGDDICVITDVCLCEYTTHGHCGVVDPKTCRIKNDETLELLARAAVSHAEAGADIVAPSAMMDGMVAAIRDSLDREGFEDVLIMSYAAKFASSFYAPFREAADSAPSFGDRSTYQMDFANALEALREVELDLKEGADIVMVKPAMCYLDVLYRVKEKFGVPTAAFNVSGEYAMIKAAASLNWLDERKTVIEVLTCIKRAGADLILTYFAKDVARMLKDLSWWQRRSLEST